MMDIAYALFNQTGLLETLKSRIKGTNEEPVKFRDGLDYFSYLEMSRKEIQASMMQEPEKWRNSIFTHWIYVLSKLSWFSNYPLHESVYSQKAWGKKVFKTQIGSYTELRHDLCLQIEQGEGFCACSHPEVYVESNLEFWLEFRKFLTNIENIIMTLNKTINEHIEMEDLSNPEIDEYGEEISDPLICNFQHFQQSEYSGTIEHIGLFKKQLSDLIDVVTLQNANKPIPKEMADNLKKIVYWTYDDYLSYVHDGWYLKLMYKMVDYKKFEYDPVVADIFTNPPLPMIGDSGSVLHLATKRPSFGVMLLENSVTKESKAMLIAGYNPVEFYEPYGTRLNDEEWKQRILAEEEGERGEERNDFDNFRSYVDSEQVRLFCGGEPEGGEYADNESNQSFHPKTTNEALEQLEIVDEATKQQENFSP
jgi:hypothetical protein